MTGPVESMKQGKGAVILMGDNGVIAEKLAPKPGRQFFFWLIVVLAQFVFLQSSFFAVESIDVVGTYLLSKDAIVKQTGIALGNRILPINSTKVANVLLDKYYLLRSVEVKKLLPRTLKIAVEERAHYLSLLTGELLYAVDNEGVVLYEIEDPANVKLPVITLEDNTLFPGLQLKGEQIKSALLAVPVIRKHFSDREVAVVVLKNGEIEIELDSSTRIKLGYPIDLSAKFALLPALLKKVEEKKLTLQYIDLRFANTPVVKMKNE